MKICLVFGRGGYIAISKADFSGLTFVAADMNITPIAYKHCAVVGDGSTIKVYRDGSLIAITLHPNWASTSYAIQIGGGSPFSSDGGMDEFLLYDDVLWTFTLTCRRTLTRAGRGRLRWRWARAFAR